MARKRRFTWRQVEAALRANAGIQSAAAKSLGCSPSAITLYIKRSKNLQKAQREITESMIDRAEGQLFLAIKAGNMTATIFFLKTKGRSRGYVQGHKHEHTGAGGGPIKKEVVYDFSGLTDEQLDRLCEGGTVELQDGTQLVTADSSNRGDEPGTP